MDPEVAKIVVAAITAVGAVVWLIALQFLIASARVRPAKPPAADEAGPAEEYPEGWLSGTANVDGEAGTLSARLATILSQASLGLLGPVKIVDKTDDSVRFEGVGLPNQQGGQAFRHGEFRFLSRGPGRTRIEWGVELTSTRWLLALGATFQVVGLIALIGIPWLIYAFVATDPDPAVRWQTFQVIHVIHFLWPPFLCGALYRRMRGVLVAQMDALAHNLPYHDNPAGLTGRRM